MTTAPKKVYDKSKNMPLKGATFYMNQMQLILQIIASCDEALRDAFLRRMDAAVLIAKNKMEQGDAIFNPAQEEAVLRQITFDLAPDLRLRAESLWRNLTRMNRGRQYRYFITNAPDLKLIHEPDMRKDMPAGKILCAARDAAAIEAACGMPTIPCESSYDALPRLLDGDAEYAALVEQKEQVLRCQPFLASFRFQRLCVLLFWKKFVGMHL